MDNEEEFLYLIARGVSIRLRATKSFFPSFLRSYDLRLHATGDVNIGGPLL